MRIDKNIHETAAWSPEFSWDRNAISAEQVKEIAQVPHFCNSEYRTLDPRDVLTSYYYLYVEPLMRMGISLRSVADVGAGYGWLAIAFALATPLDVVAVEYDGNRLKAAQKIAAILGVEERITWIVASVEDLPLEDRSIDAVFCIEVIEHTGVDHKYVKELMRTTNDVLIITTPNLIFPIINHDTALPFCHWLPLWARNLYASAFGRRKRQENNKFWSPFRLFSEVRGFTRVSQFLHFPDYAAYKRSETLIDEKNPGLLTKCMRVYFSFASKLGKHAVYVLPNLASTFRRNG